MHAAMGRFHWINTILGKLKTAISGTCHAFDFHKYAHCYLVEFQNRFNRSLNRRGMLPDYWLAPSEQKAKLIKGATQLLVDVLGKNPTTGELPAKR